MRQSSHNKLGYLCSNKEICWCNPKCWILLSFAIFVDIWKVQWKLWTAMFLWLCSHGVANDTSLSDCLRKLYRFLTDDIDMICEIYYTRDPMRKIKVPTMATRWHVIPCCTSRWHPALWQDTLDLRNTTFMGCEHFQEIFIDTCNW